MTVAKKFVGLLKFPENLPVLFVVLEASLWPIMQHACSSCFLQQRFGWYLRLLSEKWTRGFFSNVSIKLESSKNKNKVRQNVSPPLLTRCSFQMKEVTGREVPWLHQQIPQTHRMPAGAAGSRTGSQCASKWKFLTLLVWSLNLMVYTALRLECK